MHVGREAKPRPILLEQVAEADLVDRHASAAEDVDLLRDDVAHGDLVPELREAGARDQADVAGTEDGNFHR